MYVAFTKPFDCRASTQSIKCQAEFAGYAGLTWDSHLRGTSPGPRVVFDRATFSPSPPQGDS